MTSFTFEKDCSVCSIMMTEHTHYQNSNTKIPSELKERKLKAFDKLEKSCFNWISNHYPRPGQKQAVNVWQVQRPVSLCTLDSEGEVGWGWDTTRVCLGQSLKFTFCMQRKISELKEATNFQWFCLVTFTTASITGPPSPHIWKLKHHHATCSQYRGCDR